MSYLGGRKARYATASLPRPSADGRRSPSLAQASQRYLLKHMMIDALEKRLVEALKSVDAHGDVAPAHVHDPMTMLLRENAVRANLMRWDDGRGRYVLTGTGRRRISEGSRAPGAVVSFRNRASWAAVRCIGNPPTPTSRNSCSSGCASPRQDRPRRFGHLNGTILIYGATRLHRQADRESGGRSGRTPRSGGAQSGKSQSVVFVAIGINSLKSS